MFLKVHPDGLLSKYDSEAATRIFYTLDELKKELLARCEDKRFTDRKGDLKVNNARRESPSMFGGGLTRGNFSGQPMDLNKFTDLFKDVGSGGRSCTQICMSGKCEVKCRNF